MPKLAHRLTQVAISLAGALLLAVLAEPALAHYTYRGCDAEGCWRYQCDSRGENCTRTPLYGPDKRWDRNDDGYRDGRRGDYRDRRRGDYWDRRDRRRRWECDRWDRYDPYCDW